MNWILWLALLVAANVALFWLPLLPALMEWRRRSSPLHIPVDDEAGISYFADRFRQRLAADWGDALLFAPADDAAVTQRPQIARTLQSIVASQPQAVRGQYRIVEPGGTVDGAPLLRTVEQPTLVGNVVRLERGTHQIGEIYARDRLQALGGNVIRAALCDGPIELGAGSGILRWAHGRSILIAPGSRAMGRVSALDTIVVGRDCHFERLSAPVVQFGAGRAAASDSPVPFARRRLVPADFPGVRIEHQPGSSRWLCDGDIDIPDDSEIEASLVVSGRLRVGARSRLHGSIKARGVLRIAADCRIDGAVFAEVGVRIAERCEIGGPLSSGRHVVLGDDCVVGRKERYTSVVAPSIIVGRCTCHGVTWARRNGRTVG